MAKLSLYRRLMEKTVSEDWRTPLEALDTAEYIPGTDGNRNDILRQFQGIYGFAPGQETRPCLWMVVDEPHEDESFPRQSRWYATGNWSRVLSNRPPSMLPPVSTDGLYKDITRWLWGEACVALSFEMARKGIEIFLNRSDPSDHETFQIIDPYMDIIEAWLRGEPMSRQTLVDMRDDLIEIAEASEDSVAVRVTYDDEDTVLRSMIDSLEDEEPPTRVVTGRRLNGIRAKQATTLRMMSHLAQAAACAFSTPDGLVYVLAEEPDILVSSDSTYNVYGTCTNYGMARDQTNEIIGRVIIDTLNLIEKPRIAPPSTPKVWAQG